MFQIKNRLDPGRSPFSPDWECMDLGKTLGKTLLDGEWSSAVSLGWGGGGDPMEILHATPTFS